jgi:hypothetical protein
MHHYWPMANNSGGAQGIAASRPPAGNALFAALGVMSRV